MELRSVGRKLSFDILSAIPSDASDDGSVFLHRSKSEPPFLQNGVASDHSSKMNRRKRRNRKKKLIGCPISENSVTEDGTVDNSANGSVFANGFCKEELEVARKEYSSSSSVVQSVLGVPEESGEGRVCAVSLVTGGAEVQNSRGSDGYLLGELRQRNVMNAGGGAGHEEAVSPIDENESVNEENSSGKELNLETVKQWPEPNGNVAGKLEKDESLDWKRLMAEDPNSTFSVEKSPIKYFVEEMYSGNSLRSTTTIGDEKERERVYDTIFRLPWRCELLIDIGFFVCLDSFLSLLTIVPTRILMIAWRLLKTRQFKRPSAAELSDFCCFIVMAVGVTLLQQADISLIYHMIRGQGTIKLYVVYNVLEIFDKLCQNFGGDVMRTLFKSTEGLSNCSLENMGYWLWRFISDEALAVGSSIVHSFVLLAQAITLSTCIVAHNNALLALLVSNNFAEIKSNVFKRFSKDNIQSLVYFDSVERFHISAFLLFILAQNILEAEGPWFESFLFNALQVFFCEVMIDIIKHSFIAKFNDLKPIVFSEFLEDLCKQTLNIERETAKKSLTFVPLAPACVVIRVLSPVFAAHLPYSPLPWRLFWIFVLSAVTFVMLASLKVMIGMGLQKHATWYVNRCQKRKLHTD